jgi:hypothetical protein
VSYTTPSPESVDQAGAGTVPGQPHRRHQGLQCTAAGGQDFPCTCAARQYRDLYQRQTVRTATAPATPRKVTGTANLRTDVKADVMQEVLGRFEAQFEKVQSPPARPARKHLLPSGRQAGHRQGRHRHTRGEWHHPQAAGAHPARGNRLAQEVVQSRAATPSLPPKTRNALCGSPNRHHLRRQDGPHQGSRRTRQSPGQVSARHRGQESAATSATTGRSSPKAGKKAAA